MKITFPHFGNMYIPIKILFDGLGIEYIIPPINNNQALEIGTLHSPEEICLPFKIMMGNYIQSIKEGADTIALIGSNGPCRFGEYCELQKNILKNLGYDLDIIVLESPKVIGKEEFKNRVYKIAEQSPKSTAEQWMAVAKTFLAISMIENIERKALFRCGYEINNGEHKSVLYECKGEVIKTNDPDQALKILKEYSRKMDHIPVDKNKKPITVALIGEIYTVIEPFSNLHIQDKLMDCGVSIKRGLSVDWWLKNAFLKSFQLNSIGLRNASREYLPYYIGGHGRECVGEALLANKNNLDGAIQLFPMGCMPEIVSKVILQSISRDKDFPILTLIIDEMTGEGGFSTRLEAFLDLLERRREYVLSGS